jgi:predicted dehydrogenase/threonine dehydrogenase-like Zn-dependent dehydrogenase
MKQLLQNLRNGELSLLEVPVPARPAGMVLVATRASLISSGTERATVQAAQASLLGKARQRPDQVRKVLDNLRKEGLGATFAKVRDKLDQPKALGYSSAGVVLAADPDERVRAGDRVACGGADYATHAEVVVVPRNLAVPVPENVSFEEAAFATVGAIALQGVRRAEVGLGSRVLVIGLGLLGQLTWQLLEDAGCTVVGTDISPEMVALAGKIGLTRAVVRGRDDVEGACATVSDGHGVDAVIITAAAKSRDPIELAGAVARERGRVVVVGAVPMEVPREPFYRKELDVVVSRSYGPGRYDREYEEGGVDYPIAHARWTEGRNLSAVLEAIARGRVRVQPLITHRFPLAQAEQAYAIVSGADPQPHVGIVLTYSETPSLAPRVALRPVPAPPGSGRPGIAFIGAGSFARGYLLPHLKGRADIELVTVATARGYTAADAARKFGFAEAASDAERALADERVQAVFIATRHDEHARLAQAALAAGKHVFVEKPLAVSPAELAALLPVAARAGRVLQVGFNRRFSPLAVALRQVLAGAAGPVQVTYRVSAGPLPSDHWLLDPHAGGGRMVGEGCHFIDLIQYLTGEHAARVSAAGFGDDATGARTVLLEMSGGSVGVLVYQANASARVPKERIEAFAGGRGGVLHDWRSVDLLEDRQGRTLKAAGQAKGFAEEVAAFLTSLRTGAPAIPLESLAYTTAATFAVLRSIAERQPVDVILPPA